MKKLFLAFLFLFPVATLAQNNPTLVTGTITDSNLVPYYPATVTACLTPVTTDPLVNNQHVNTRLGANYCAPLANTNASGFFSLSLFANSVITPGGTQWQFTVTTLGAAPPAGKGPQTFAVPITISGSSQDVGATLTAAAPILLNSGAGGAVTCANLPALTGDATTSAGSCATTLATVTASKGGTGVASPTAHALLAFEGSSAAQNVCTPPSANGDYNIVYHVTGAAAVDPTCPQVGLGGAAGLTGAATTYTVLFSDNGTVLTHDKAASGAINVTLNTATTLGNPNFAFRWADHSAQSDTITPTTWTIQKNNLVAGGSISVGSGETCLIKVDPNLATQWLADCNVLVPTLVAIAGGTNGFLSKFNSTGNEVPTLCDEAITTANTITCTDTAGIVAPRLATGSGCTSLTAGTAATDCLVEGTAPSANQASADTPWADATAHSPKVMNNGSLLQSLYVLSEPSPISLTGQVATITNGTSLCAAAAGACNQAGQYRATIYLDSTVTCATPGPAAAAPTLTWTDETGVKTAVPFPMFVNGSTTPASSITLGNTTSWGSGSLTFWSTGAVIGYGVAWTACTSGTATYAVRIAVERLQ